MILPWGIQFDGIQINRHSNFLAIKKTHGQLLHCPKLSFIKKKKKKKTRTDLEIVANGQV
jgi:hypothetical protein